MGKVGTDEPTITTAESYAILEALRASHGAQEVHIYSDSKSCVATFKDLEHTTPRAWTRLANRWVWRQTARLKAERLAAGQKITVEWVRAHTDGTSTEAVWNDVADMRAKEAADEERPDRVMLPWSERRWVLLHEKACVCSDVLKYVGQLHEKSYTEALRKRSWAPTSNPGVDLMCVEHVVKARDGEDLQSYAVQMWARAGLRTITRLAEWNKDSELRTLADMAGEGGLGCPLCPNPELDDEYTEDTTDHILGVCACASEAREDAVAETLTNLQSYGTWGWWEAATSRNARNRRRRRAFEAWAGEHGVSLEAWRATNGAEMGKRGGLSLPRSTWRGIAQEKDMADTDVLRWVKLQQEKAQENGFWALPPQLHKTLLRELSVEVEAEVCPAYRVDMALDRQGREDAGLNVAGWQGKFVFAHTDDIRAEKATKAIKGVLGLNAGTRIVLAVKGESIDPKRLEMTGGKLMCRWGDGSVPAVTSKHLVSGPPAGRQRKDCLKSLVSVYVWEDERAAEVQIHVGAIQQAALGSIRGREARRKVRWGKSTGEWAAPSVPAALATHVSLGFDREIARAACSKYRNSSAPAWGGGDPTRIGTPATFPQRADASRPDTPPEASGGLPDGPAARGERDGGATGIGQLGCLAYVREQDARLPQ